MDERSGMSGGGSAAATPAAVASERPLAHDELAALLQINRALGRQRDRDALLAAIAQAVAGLLPADHLVALIPGPESTGVRTYAVGGAATPLAPARNAEGSVLAHAMRDRRPIVISSSASVREAFPATHRQLADEGMESAVVLPLLAREQCLGAVGFLAAAPGAWDGVPRRLLDEIGLAVAGAVDTCLDYEQQRRMSREANALLEVSRAIGRHIHRDELFGALAGCLRAVVPTDRFGIELPIEDDRLQGHLLTPCDGRAGPTQPTVLPAPGTACDWVLRNREWLVVPRRAALREPFPVTFAVMEQEAMQSLCALPLVTHERCRGVLFFMAAQEGAYDHLRRGFIEEVASAVAVALDDCLAHEEVRQLRDQLAAENVYLQEEIKRGHDFSEIVGNSEALRRVLALVEKVASTSATALILGETGTGKELIARAIHDRSPRRERPLIKVNCAAIAAGLVESELFGHVKGAFTGAVTARSGRFELADGGTIFLDEIGELPPETQVKLLRVLQEREFEPVGSSQTRRVDVRVIAATNRDLAREAAEGRFRTDLFYRLNVLPIVVPPLRERREDVPPLVHFYVERAAREIAKRIERVPRRTMERLMAYGWPGNVRELQNVVERAVVLAKGPELEVDADLLPPDPAPRGSDAPPAAPAGAPDASGGGRHLADAPHPPASLEEVTRQHTLRALERSGWVIDGPHGAAHRLGLKPSTLRSRMKKLGLERRPHGAAPAR